jgi:sodium-dependent dicarboxylate transporter 2/3/5
VAAGLALFLVPAGAGRGEALLDWPTARRLPWGVLLLFGGGLSLAAAIRDTGLAVWIGEAMRGLGVLPAPLVVLLATAVILLLTELTSNTATAAAFLPVLASMALGLGIEPLRLLVPATLAASCAFMLPVATPPNAIVYGSGRVSVPQMARAGAWLNLAMLLLVFALSWLLVPLVLG